MKQKSVILSILCTFILMMACTPSSLRRGKAPEAEQAGAVVSLPQVKTPDIAPDSVTLPALIDSIANANNVQPSDTSVSAVPAVGAAQAAEVAQATDEAIRN